MLSLRGGGLEHPQEFDCDVHPQGSPEKNKKMSKSPTDPPHSSGLTLIGTLLNVNYEMC